jgi:hypothetical protein
MIELEKRMIQLEKWRTLRNSLVTALTMFGVVFFSILYSPNPKDPKQAAFIALIAAVGYFTWKNMPEDLED